MDFDKKVKSLSEELKSLDIFRTSKIIGLTKATLKLQSKVTELVRNQNDFDDRLKNVNNYI